jgi:1,4-alpha-glucan branching enzyme
VRFRVWAPEAQQVSVPGRLLESLVFYEIHIGTFTHQGTFDGQTFTF